MKPGITHPQTVYLPPMFPHWSTTISIIRHFCVSQSVICKVSGKSRHIFKDRAVRISLPVCAMMSHQYILRCHENQFQIMLLGNTSGTSVPEIIQIHKLHYF